MNKYRIIAAAACMALMGGCAREQATDYTGSGTIEATEITVSSLAGGRITNLYVAEGHWIAPGDTIALIDVEKLELQREISRTGLDEADWNEKILDREKETLGNRLSQAETKRDNAKKNFDRVRALFDAGAATREALDGVETAYELAAIEVDTVRKQIAGIETKRASIDAVRKKIEAGLSLLDRQIADGTVIALSGGVVLEKYAEEGEVVGAGMPICSIGDLSTVWLIIYVGESDVGRISLGAKANVTIDSHPGETFPGTVTWIAETAEFTPKNVQTRDSRVDLVYAVKITLDNPDGIFKIGMPADAAIEGL